MRLGDASLLLLSHDWSGLALAAAVALPGVLLAFYGGDVLALRAVGLLMVALAIVMSAGAVAHVLQTAAAVARHPAPGRMVTANGFKMHVLAEGQTTSLPAIVLFGGGHSPGAVVHHLHRALRQDTRSILIDRPGTGWSGVARFPLRTADEAVAIIDLLEQIGERGPFVFAGHSFGGLLCANIARRSPDLTAALVLMDATPPDTIVYGPRLDALKAMRREAFRRGILGLFSIRLSVAAKQASQSVQVAKWIHDTEDAIGPALEAHKALAKRVRNAFGEYSIFKELSPEGMAAVGWDTNVCEGELNGVPTYLIAPREGSEVEALARSMHGETPAARRMIQFFARTRERYMSVSDRAQRIVTPAGSGHNYPYEVPDFLINELKRILRT